ASPPPPPSPSPATPTAPAAPPTLSLHDALPISPARSPPRSRRAQAAAAYEPGGAPGATHPGHPQGRRALMGCQVPMRHRALAGCRAPIPCPVRSYRNAEASCSYCKVLGMPRIVDHAARRTEIVYALWAVIHEKGLDSVSFRAVA